MCVVCDKNKQKPKKIKEQQGYLPYCSSCQKKLYENKKKRKRKPSIHKNRRPYLIVYQKLDSCESCGFVAEHSCQLDVDHIDGNNSNNSLENLQTLCSNCHRLKTYKNKDWEPREP